jgi:hypothetical protein
MCSKFGILDLLDNNSVSYKFVIFYQYDHNYVS